MQTRWKWGLAVALGIVLAIPAGTYIYINFIRDDAPEKLTLEGPGAGPSTTVATGGAGGGTGARRPTGAPPRSR